MALYIKEKKEKACSITNKGWHIPSSPLYDKQRTCTGSRGQNTPLSLLPMFPGLSVFLASCNHQEDWVGLAEMRARQYGQLADLLLGYIPQYAQSETSRAFALSLKYLATHHFNVSPAVPSPCQDSGTSPLASVLRGRDTDRDIDYHNRWLHVTSAPVCFVGWG